MRPRFEVEGFFFFFVAVKKEKWGICFPMALFRENNPKYVMQKFIKKGTPTCIIWDNCLSSQILKVLF